MTSTIALSQALTLLVSPPTEELSRCLSLFHGKDLEKGEYFLRAGDTSKHIAFINSGLLRFYYQTKDGKEQNKTFVRENDFAGAYGAYLTQHPIRFSIQALEQSQLLVAELEQVLSLFDTHRCWEKLGRLLAEQLYVKKETREAEFLLDDAETRYKNFQRNYPGLEERLPQYHIASYLGITPVMLSRIRRR